MKIKLITIFLVSLCVLIISGAMFNRATEKSAFSEKRAILACRAIGDKLLTLSGDNSSRVLPVKHNGNGTFQLEFQSEFTFVPDSLVKIVQNSLNDSELSSNYVVSVFSCLARQMVYGFEINAKQEDNIPCLGRKQPMGCYTIDIDFVDFNTSIIAGFPYSIFLIIALGLSFMMYIGQPFIRNKGKLLPDNMHLVDVGQYAFDGTHRKLISRHETITLSEKECQLLQILAAEQNQVVSRDRLLKKVWEDDGVFTGRSLDMFISKLRKKLKNDPSIQITNIYGKGYRLEI